MLATTSIKGKAFIQHLDKNLHSALVGIETQAQWIEPGPVNQRVTDLVPHWGTFLDCGPGSHLGVCERQPHIDVSLPLFLLPFPSL